MNPLKKDRKPLYQKNNAVEVKISDNEMSHLIDGTIEEILLDVGKSIGALNQDKNR